MHVLMSAYGWTLDEALALTLPQMVRLFAAIQKYPPVNVIAPALLSMMRADDAAGNKLAEGSTRMGLPVETLAGQKVGDFLRNLGVEV